MAVPYPDPHTARRFRLERRTSRRSRSARLTRRRGPADSSGERTSVPPAIRWNFASTPGREAPEASIELARRASFAFPVPAPRLTVPDAGGYTRCSSPPRRDLFHPRRSA